MCGRVYACTHAMTLRTHIDLARLTGSFGVPNNPATFYLAYFVTVLRAEGFAFDEPLG